MVGGGQTHKREDAMILCSIEIRKLSVLLITFYSLIQHARTGKLFERFDTFYETETNFARQTRFFDMSIFGYLIGYYIFCLY